MLPPFRIGYGIDVHRLIEGRPLIIGGVSIPHDRGLEGHSDADVLLHALTDAILGAAGRGDIGGWFPDTDEKWRGASSILLLETVWRDLSAEGWSVVNVDSTIVAQAPRLSPYFEQMRANICQVLGIDGERCNLKATTSEKLGYEGRKEGITAYSSVLITR